MEAVNTRRRILPSLFEPAFKRILQQENSPTFDNVSESSSKLYEVWEPEHKFIF